jgi:hypothetical protein
MNRVHLYESPRHRSKDDFPPADKYIRELSDRDNLDEQMKL